MALSGRKFPSSDRLMSWRITAPAHTVGAAVSFVCSTGPSASGDGFIEGVNYEPGVDAGRVRARRHKPRTKGWCGSYGGFEKQRAGTKDPGADSRSPVRDGDRCSDNHTPLGASGLLDARGSRRASGCARRQPGDQSQTAAQASHRRATGSWRLGRMRKITRRNSQGA